MIKKIIYQSERFKVLSLIGKLSQSHSVPLKILDIGCGYGANMIPLVNLGHNVVGVDINRDIVEENRKKSLNCLTSEEFEKAGDFDFDLIIMSHVIEHFSPSALISFMDGYLDHLKPKGHLLIATPLMSDYFYDDFDHVKPYQPTGILMVFGGKSAQVQYYSRNKISLQDLWYRKSFYRLHHNRTRYIKSVWSIPLKAFDAISILLYLSTFRAFGKTDGWVGLFIKTQSYPKSGTHPS
jgi:SAM-dependent methyltransferase